MRVVLRRPKAQDWRIPITVYIDEQQVAVLRPGDLHDLGERTVTQLRFTARLGHGYMLPVAGDPDSRILVTATFQYLRWLLPKRKTLEATALLVSPGTRCRQAGQGPDARRCAYRSAASWSTLRPTHLRERQCVTR